MITCYLKDTHLKFNTRRNFSSLICDSGTPRIALWYKSTFSIITKSHNSAGNSESLFLDRSARKFTISDIANSQTLWLIVILSNTGLIFSAYQYKLISKLSSPISMTSISSQSSVGSGKSRRFLKLKLSLPVSSASLKHLSSGIFPDMVGFTCYKGNIGTLSRHLFRRLADILENPTASCRYCAWFGFTPISLCGLRQILACSRARGFIVVLVGRASDLKHSFAYLAINLNEKLTLDLWKLAFC